ncbi:MAG: 30S ribosomal protein S17 [Candidatus Blackburnbacteria bacterium]|nr:30S ribosomal protein S17 [Candidatus Blackburnbacteria bacterium]
MKKFTGLVVSNKNKNTAIVEVTRFLVHPIYEKRVKRTKRYPAHDEVGVNVGDKVQFVESRPYSATKRWKITRMLVQAGENGIRQTANRKEKKVKNK